jgi:hypothetical protein
LPVRLDDKDALEGNVNTRSSDCSVVSDTQIIATFPAGIRTNGSTGWNILVTNAAGTSSTSAVRFVPVAGLLISEVFPGASGLADHEFVELYNPTEISIDAAALIVRLHIVSAFYRHNEIADTGSRAKRRHLIARVPAARLGAVDLQRPMAQPRRLQSTAGRPRSPAG